MGEEREVTHTSASQRHETWKREREREKQEKEAKANTSKTKEMRERGKCTCTSAGSSPEGCACHSRHSPHPLLAAMNCPLEK